MQLASLSIKGLLKKLREEFAALIKQEVQLAKSEMSEKISHFSKNIVAMVMGGFIAYAGVIVLLAGIGFLIGFAFERSGMERTLALCIGLGIIGLAVSLTGLALILRAKSVFSQETMTPEKTIHSMRELRGAEETHPIQPPKQRVEKPSSEQAEAQVEQAQYEFKKTLHQLGAKVNPRRVDQAVRAQVQTHPMRSMAASLAGGFLSAFLMLRRRSHPASA